jgi:tetratricopeptide (TPR) repeat protein
VWADLGSIILKDGLAEKALPYLEHAYKVTGDVPGINYLLASFYLHSRSIDKAYRHLSLALNLDKELFSEFEDIFPPELFTRKIKKLLDRNDLI